MDEGACGIRRHAVMLSSIVSVYSKFTYGLQSNMAPLTQSSTRESCAAIADVSCRHVEEIDVDAIGGDTELCK